MRSKPSAIALVVGLVVNVAVLAQAPERPVPSSYSLWEFGTMPRPAFKQVLLGKSRRPGGAEADRGPEEGDGGYVESSIREDSEGAPRDHRQGKVRDGSREQSSRRSRPRSSRTWSRSSATAWTRSSSSRRGRWPSTASRIPGWPRKARPGERLKLTDDQIKRTRRSPRKGTSRDREGGRTSRSSSTPRRAHRPPSRSRSWSRRRNSRRPRRRPARPPGKPGTPSCSASSRS